MRITVTSLSAGGSDEICVSFELAEGDKVCREKFLIPTDAYLSLGVEKGEVDTEIYNAVEREAQIYSAFKRGLYILSYGACSGRMLMSKLVLKGAPREAAECAVERICARGFMNEEANALREAEICLGKLWGEGRIKAHLIKRRYSAEIIDQVFFSLEDSGVDFDLLCKKAIAAKYKKLPEDRAEMQKLVAAVCRLGYDLSQIKCACAALREEYRKRRIYYGE